MGQDFEEIGWMAVSGEEDPVGDFTELAGADDDLSEAEALLAASAGARARRKRGPGLMVQRRGGRPRFIDLGFPTLATLAAAGQANFVARPQVTMRPQRFIIDSSAGTAGLQVDDIRIGNRSQFADANPIPALSFGATTLGAQRWYDTARAGLDVVVRVTNVSAAAITSIMVTASGPAIQ